MLSDKIVLNFEVERGDPIDGGYFSARIKLTNGSKDFLREKLGSKIQLDNLDNYFDLKPENFYIWYNHYGYRDEMYVRDDSGGYLGSNFPVKDYPFSMELSADGPSIVDYGFYNLYAIYNPKHYDRAKKKVFDDHGKLSQVASDVLDNFLSNKNTLSTQNVLQNISLQMQKEVAEEVARLAREREEEKQREEELNKKNEELKELIEKHEIKIFKVIKGHDIGDGRSAAILQPDGRKGNEITLDTSKYYIVEYNNYEYLNCVHPSYDMLVHHHNLFFVLNQSPHADFESGFYSASSTNLHNYAKYYKEDYLDGDQLSEKLFNKFEGDGNQVGAKFITNDEQVAEKIVAENEIKARKKRVDEEDKDSTEESSNSVSIQTKKDELNSEQHECIKANQPDEVQDELASQETPQNAGRGLYGYSPELSISRENNTQADQPASEERNKRSIREDEEKREETIVIDKKSSKQHPLKIKTGEIIGDVKYKAVLQAQDQDIDNFYQNLSSQYTAGKYNYDQMIVLYDKVYIQDSRLDGKPVTLSEAYVTNGHLFIKDQDYGVLNDFNEMFYKSDELY